MNIKRIWIQEFEKFLLEHEPLLNKTNPHYSYQLASAYFDWNFEGTAPERSVEQAFIDYIRAQIDD